MVPYDKLADRVPDHYAVVPRQGEVGRRGSRQNAQFIPTYNRCGRLYRGCAVQGEDAVVHPDLQRAEQVELDAAADVRAEVLVTLTLPSVSR